MVFFVVILAAVLWLYRFFRKRGRHVASPLVADAKSSTTDDGGGGGSSVALRESAQDKGTTWAQVDADASRLAQHVAKLGLLRGSTVRMADASPSLRQWAAFELGVQQAGMVACLEGTVVKELHVKTVLDDDDDDEAEEDTSLPEPGPHEGALRLVSGRVLSHGQLRQMLKPLQAQLHRGDAVAAGCTDEGRLLRLAALRVKVPVAPDGASWATMRSGDAAKVAKWTLQIEDGLKGMWLGSWAANVARRRSEDLSLIKRLLLPMEVIVADVLFWPRASDPVLGSRCVALCCAEADEKHIKMLTGMEIAVYRIQLTK